MGGLGLLEWYELTRSTIKIKDAKSVTQITYHTRNHNSLIKQPEKRNRPYWAPACNLHYHLKILEMKGKLNPACRQAQECSFFY